MQPVTKYRELHSSLIKTSLVKQSCWLLKMKQPTVKPQVYVKGVMRLRRNLDSIIRPADVDLITENSEVCCLGLLALARLRRFTELRWSNIPFEFSTFDNGVLRINSSRESILFILQPFICRRQIDMIETAFEGSLGYSPCRGLSKPEYEAASEFRRLYTDPSERVQAILDHLMADRRRMFRPMSVLQRYQLDTSMAA